MLRKAYGLAVDEELNIPCFETWKNGGSNDAWDMAVCLMNDRNQIQYASSTGTPITGTEAINKMQPGDLMFTINKDSWCRWTGYNEYKGDGSNHCGTGTALRTGSDKGYCTENSMLSTTISSGLPTPKVCDFNENGQVYSNFPIVTHVAIYLGNGIAAYYNNNVKIRTGTVARFVGAVQADGIRIIVRPDYPELEN